MFLWLGKQCSPQWLYSVLGAGNIQIVDMQMVCLCKDSHARSRSLFCLLADSAPHTGQWTVCSRAQHCGAACVGSRPRDEGLCCAVVVASAKSVIAFVAVLLADHCQAEGRRRVYFHAIPG